MTLPAPPVPPDADLRKFPYMPLDVARLRDSDFAALASAEEFRAAVVLWCAAWHQVPAASLPDDDAVLAKMAGFGRSVAAWREVKEGAMKGFAKHSDGRFYHPVIAEKANESWRKSKTFTERSRRANEAKRSKVDADVDQPDAGAKKPSRSENTTLKDVNQAPTRSENATVKETSFHDDDSVKNGLSGYFDEKKPSRSENGTYKVPETAPTRPEKRPKREGEVRESQEEAKGLLPSTPLAKVENKKLPFARKNSSATDDVDADFEAWYATYPRHVGRGQAIKAYRGARKKADADALLSGAQRYAVDVQARGQPQFTKHPSTWLNGECWRDEMSFPNGNGGGRRVIEPLLTLARNSSHDPDDMFAPLPSLRRR